MTGEDRGTRPGGDAEVTALVRAEIEMDDRARTREPWDCPDCECCVIWPISGHPYDKGCPCFCG